MGSDLVIDVSRSSGRPGEPGNPRGTPATGGRVRLVDVSKVYGNASNPVHALDRLSLDIEAGEFVCVLGASGCGKSTLLNLVAGLDRASGGDLTVEGHTTLMFQEPALFPWLTAARNVELPLRLEGLGRAERRARVDELLGMVHLQEFAAKRPHELSGGMRQRVALARALGRKEHAPARSLALTARTFAIDRESYKMPALELHPPASRE